MNQENPKVSVIMPVYNGEKYLKLAIESILNQTYQNLEFIIVNDASNDKTEEIIKNYQKQDSRIIYLKNEKNLNIAGSLNRGIKESKSDYIVRMDCDDISLPNRISDQVEAIDTKQNIGVVGCNINLINEQGEIIATRKYPTSDLNLKKVMFRYNPFAHPGTIIRKKCFTDVGYYNEKLSPTEDLDLWFRIGTKYKFKSIDKVLLNYRLYTNSSSNKNLKKSELNTLKIRLNAFRNLGYRPSLFDMFFNIVQFFSIWIIPSKWKIQLFNFIRNR